MADVDFSKLLSKKVDDAKPLPPLPAGTYRGIVKKFEFGKSREKETPYVGFIIQFLSAEDDVDAAELTEIDLTKITKQANFYLTESSDYRLANFLKSLGIKTEGRSFSETIPEAVNGMVLVPVTQRLDKNDPTRIFNDVGDITGA